jgi:mannose-6-phosphate isomerase
MATSDNVVRGGLTPKLKDAKVLVSMLTYETGNITPVTGEVDCHKVVYNSGFDEFSMVKVTSGSKDDKASYCCQNPGIMIVLEGNGNVTIDDKLYKVNKFDTFYCLPGKDLGINSSDENGLTVYIATLGS